MITGGLRHDLPLPLGSFEGDKPRERLLQVCMAATEALVTYVGK
jgi:hypothetical protein